jgi:site-specific DNA recombinase
VRAERVQAGSLRLNGNRTRGTGILNNPLCAGHLHWNRLVHVKDPESGRRRSRPRAKEEQIVKNVPALHIVDETLWAAVKRRQSMLGGRHAKSSGGQDEPAPFWSKQRLRYLFSGLMRCGISVA